MRQLSFLVLLGIAASLGGCASSPPTAMCPWVASTDFRQDFIPPQTKSSQPIASSHSRLSHKVAVVTAQPAIVASTPEDAAPEPRFTSPEWWARENARLRKVMVICSACQAASVVTASLPKPAIPDFGTDLDALPRSSFAGPLPFSSAPGVEPPVANPRPSE